MSERGSTATLGTLTGIRTTRGQIRDADGFGQWALCGGIIRGGVSGGGERNHWGI